MVRLFVVALVGVIFATEATAQAVPPRWNYQGSAVCPEGFDFHAYQGLCIARGYGTRHYGGNYYSDGPRNGIPPRWNRAGSAVCPQGFDFHARHGLCFPQ